MKQRLALAVGVLTLVASIMLGVAAAGAKQGVAGTGVNLPGVDAVLPVCSNFKDDDGDGLSDLNDPGCAGNPLGTSEIDPPAPAPTPSVPPTTGPTGPTGSSGTPGGGNGGGNGGKNPTGNSGNGGGAPSVTNNDGIGAGGANNNGNVISGATIKAPKGPRGKGGGTPAHPPAPFLADGAPTIGNPTTTLALFGPAPVGVPNFVIDSFEIPPFLLPIYQACGTQYGIPWQVLASINKIETAFGTNLNVSTAGAMGWMQFIPSTWAGYGVDANGDGRKDPYNPVDAICAAARYLRAAGGNEDIRRAIFAYNHADWYVDEVLLYARAYGQLPDDLVSSLTGLTEGAHFPVAADARYADDISTRQALRDSTTQRTVAGNAAEVVSTSPTRRGINIFSRKGAPIVAVNDGVIKAIGQNKKMGRFIVLQDAYGNRYTYAGLGHVESVHPVPKQEKLTADDFKLITPPDDAAPKGPATTTSQKDKAQLEQLAARHARDGENEGASNVKTGSASGSSSPDGFGKAPAAKAPAPSADSGSSQSQAATGPVNTENARARVFAHPERSSAKANGQRASLRGQVDALAGKKVPGYVTFRNYFDDVFKFDASTTELRPLKVGSKVVAGTVIGRMAGSEGGIAPHMNFAIKPAGRGAPQIDPKPILDGWKLLEATAIYRAAGKNPFASNLGIGGVLLLSKEDLQRRVLSDPALEIYSCGRNDIANGTIDRRVLAAMEYLVAKGFRLTITSLQCGHGFLTSSGNVSEHTTGDAMDIAAINGIPVTGHQGPGGLPDSLIKSLLELQGNMAPHQIISLEDLPGPQSFALADHYDHVHVGYHPVGGASALDNQFVELLRPAQWQRLIDRIGQINEPTVPVKPSTAAIPVEGAKPPTGQSANGASGAKGAKGAATANASKRGSAAHFGD